MNEKGKRSHSWLTTKEILVRQQRAKNMWLSSLNNNRKRWKIAA